MAKKLINLLIESEPDSKALRRLKKITPISSVTLIIIFVVLHVISLIYVKVNLNDYTKIQNEVSVLEKKISSSKSSEALYITTIGVLEKIKNILSRDTKIISNTLPALFAYQNNEVLIDNISVDNTGPVSFTVKTVSIDSMNNFVDELKKSEEFYSFSEVKASGILRETDGSYSFSINLKVNPINKNGQ